MINIVENVYIGAKDIKIYISACLYAMEESEEFTLVSRGNNIKHAVDIAAILIREYVESPEYTVVIGSEGFEERNVSTLEITIKGKKKDESDKSVHKED